MKALPDPEATREVTVDQVVEWREAIDRGEVLLIDCREPEEWDLCRIAAARLVPLSRFPEAVAKLADAQSKPWIVYCHHGMRSLRAVDWLRAQGQSQAWSMQGGIDAWSRRVDPTVPTY